METTFIYGLTDPDSGEIRYVGKSNNPAQRIRRHIHDAQKAKNVHRLSWIKGLLDNGKKPGLVILEEVAVSEWGEKENFWISKFPNLTNMIDGGKFCPMLVPEIAAKVGLKARGRKVSEETCAKLSAVIKMQWDTGVRSRKLRPWTDEEKAQKAVYSRQMWSERTAAQKQAVGQSITEAKNKPVIGFDATGKIIYRFASSKIASEKFGLSKDRIARCVRENLFCVTTACFWAKAEANIPQIQNISRN